MITVPSVLWKIIFLKWQLWVLTAVPVLRCSSHRSDLAFPPWLRSSAWQWRFGPWGGSVARRLSSCRWWRGSRDCGAVRAGAASQEPGPRQATWLRLSTQESLHRDPEPHRGPWARDSAGECGRCCFQPEQLRSLLAGFLGWWKCPSEETGILLWDGNVAALKW